MRRAQRQASPAEQAIGRRVLQAASVQHGLGRERQRAPAAAALKHLMTGKRERLGCQRPRLWP